MWVIITLAAAAFQVARTALQHRLRALLSVSGAGFVRYAYGAPLALFAVAVCLTAGEPRPHPPWRFWPLVTGAGVAQILGTIGLIRAFDLSGFAVGTVYSKTEVVQVAVFSAVFLGEPLRWPGWIATVVCLVGVALLSVKGSLSASLRPDRAAAYGIGAGGLFGLAAVGIRASSKSLTDSVGAGHVVLRALVTLAVMNTLQTLLHGSYLALREPGQIRLGFTHWRSSATVGVLSVCGSACWALAVTLQNAARVRAFGQVELLFTFAVAHFWLRDKHVLREYVAAALVLAGVVGVLVGG